MRRDGTGRFCAACARELLRPPQCSHSIRHTNARCSCLDTQLKRQGRPSIVQQLIDCGLPLQAATQLTLWAQSCDHPTRAPTLRSNSPALLDHDDESTFVAARPVSAVAKLRVSPTASSSRPRSSIGMSRALSPVNSQFPAPAPSAAPTKSPHSPPISVTSSTPTNIIVRSFRDIEHRAQLLQRAKTSSARIMSSQPLVIPNVPPPPHLSPFALPPLDNFFALLTHSSGPPSSPHSRSLRRRTLLTPAPARIAATLRHWPCCAAGREGGGRQR